MPSVVQSIYSRMLFFSIVSFLSIAKLCDSTQAVKGTSLGIELNSFGLPIITLCQKYRLLLDTGSKDTWIADLSCQGCPQKTSVCPQSQQKSQEIKYFKGAIQGDLAFVGTCLGSHRIICATQAQGMEQVGSMGILGLRSNSTGKNIVKNILQIHKIQQHSFAFYQGYKENILFFGEIPERFIKQELSVSINEHQWEILVNKLTFGPQDLQAKGYSAFIDTGSNMLIVPIGAEAKIKGRLSSIMKQIGCLEQSDHLTFYCSKHPPIQHQIFTIELGNGSSINLSLTSMMKKKQENYKFLIESGKESTVIIGGSLMSSYIISFHLDGKIQIFKTNKTQLQEQQIINFKLILLEYLALVAALSLLFAKVYQLAQVAINRKIVI